MFAFGSIYWSGFLTKTEIGAIWFIGVLAEFLFFIRGDSCFKFLQYRGFMTLAILSGFTCWLICGLSHSFVIILIARILGGVSFATTHISAVKSLSNGAGGPNRATSMTLYGVLAWSLPTGLIGWGSVILYNSGGGHNGEFGFIIMAVITLLSIPFIFMNKKEKIS